MSKALLPIVVGIAAALGLLAGGLSHAQQKAKNKTKANAAIPENPRDARNTPTGKSQQPRDPQFAHYGIYEQSAPRAIATTPIATSLPLDLKTGDHIAFIGNTLFERSQLY